LCFSLGASGYAADESLEPTHPQASPSADREYIEKSPFTLSLFVENDTRLFKPIHPSDRYYTNGVKLSLSHEPDWADRLNELVPFKAPVDYTRTTAGYVFGQNIYTPEHTGLRNPDPDDRPYAGWLYGGVFWERIAAREMDHYEINLGTTGPAAWAEQAQNGFHDFEEVNEARGWNHQLRDEIAFDFIYYRKWKFPLLRGGELPWAEWLQSDVIPRAGFTAGTAHVHADLGATWRAGFNLPDDFGPTRLAEPSPAAPSPGARRLGTYGFVRIDGRAVAHDLFLEGNTFENSRGVSPKPLVGEVQTGVAIYYRGLEFSYSQTYQTQEFEGQAGSHGYGAMVLSWSCAF
jgi:hypothetical protein